MSLLECQDQERKCEMQSERMRAKGRGIELETQKMMDMRGIFTIIEEQFSH